MNHTHTLGSLHHYILGFLPQAIFECFVQQSLFVVMTFFHFDARYLFKGVFEHGMVNKKDGSIAVAISKAF